ncbi:MAG: hypothetical protein IJP02_00440 [Oscillospiraceae bacterium]|nr:hypothetical protein [Oscillospiraceae bacterium]
MTDLHTHILPGMDDGAADVEQSLAMLAMEAEQGVTRVALTPHFYPKRESVCDFLTRRQAAYDRLTEAISRLPETERARLPKMYLGAEVAWQSDLLDCADLSGLCLGDGRYMLVELPFTAWNRQTVRQLWELMACHGITPVIAHLERYLADQSSKMVDSLLELDIPVQISCDILGHVFARRRAMKLLRSGQAHLIATDCHDCSHRAPNMARGLSVLTAKLGRERVEELQEYARTLVDH